MRTLAAMMSSLFALSACTLAHADGFTLESASFGPNTTLGKKLVYNQGKCKGDNTSPELHWSGAPAGTKSFAVTLFDPDARDGAGFWHWLLFDIDAKTTSLAPGAGEAAGSNVPPGSVTTKNGFGNAGYSGPCPPIGDKAHRYVFTVYALRTEKLGLGADATPEAVKKALEENTILSTSVQGLYAY
jgi:Raf kinase inhibitor-like YbhB/YbcL family protein